MRRSVSGAFLPCTAAEYRSEPLLALTLDVRGAEESRPAAGWNPKLAEGTGFSIEHARPPVPSAR
jgi:hypothetical protein